MILHKMMPSVIIVVLLFVIVAVKAQSFDPLSSHVLETSTGIPAYDIQVDLYQRPITGSREWLFVSTRYTGANGRVSGFIDEDDYVLGNYKYRLNTSEFYSRTNTPTFFPFIEVLFDVTNVTEKYHVPVLLNPFGYSTYKGSSFSAGPPPPPAPNPITSSLLDTVNGVPAPFVMGHFYRLIDNVWTLIISKNTTAAGQFVNLYTNSCDFVAGNYKFSFETQSYWASKGFTSLFPTTDIYITVDDPTERYLVPVQMSPNMYTTYKGNSSTPDPVPCSS